MTVERPLTEPSLPPEPDPAPDHEDGRRYPSTIGGICYIGVMVIASVGLGIVATGDWRLGIRWIGAGLVLASVARLVLPVRDAGMLAVRHRAVDCVMLAGVGAILIFLASTIPNQPL